MLRCGCFGGFEGLQVRGLGSELKVAKPYITHVIS